MKRRRLLIPLVLLPVLALTCGAGLKWLIETPDGTRWLMKSLSRHTAVTLTARSITGGLSRELRIEELAIRWSDGELSVQQLIFRFQPRLLISGSISIPELRLIGVNLRDAAPADPAGPIFTWPELTSIPPWLTVRIDKLSLQNVSYQNRKEPPVPLPDLAATLSWKDSLLTLSELSLTSPDAVATGLIRVGFSPASLLSSLTLLPNLPFAGTSRILLQTRLSPGRSPEQVSGEIGVRAYAGEEIRYTLTGDLGLTQREIKIHTVTLVEKGRRGSVAVAGDLLFNGTAHLHLQGNNLDLKPELGTESSLSGILLLSGTIDRYTGRIQLMTTGNGWRTSALDANITGDADHAELSNIAASLLNGILQGRLRFAWKDDVSVEGKLRGNGLNPARIDPAWQGVLNLDIHGRAVWHEGKLLKGELAGTVPNSRLHTLGFSGAFDAGFSGDDITIKQAALVGDGISASATGTLSRRLDVAAEIRDLSSLLPDASGALSLTGWSRYNDGVIRGAISGYGKNLALAGVRIGSANLDLQLPEGLEHSAQGNAELRDLHFREAAADSISLQGDGTLEEHQVSLNLDAGAGTLSGTISGSYGAGRWQGELRMLEGKDQVGPWQLEAPARLTIARDDITISRLFLSGLQEERLELSGRFDPESDEGSATATWRQFELARLEPVFAETWLAGQTDGTISVDLLPGDRVQIQGRATGTGTIAQGTHNLTIRNGALTLAADDQGSRAELELTTDTGSHAAGRFFSPLPATRSFPKQGRLDSSWQRVDLSLFAPWLPDSVALSGIISGDLSLLLLPGEKFSCIGTVASENGAIIFSPNSVQFENIGMNARFSGDNLTFARSVATGDKGPRLTIAAAASGRALMGKNSIALKEVQFDLSTSQHGTTAAISAAAEGGVSASGRFASTEPARFAFPDRGDFALSWEGLDAGLANAWLPARVHLGGRLSGEASGKLLSGKKFDLQGTVQLANGSSSWTNDEKSLEAKVRTSGLTWKWRGDTLSGSLALSLAGLGKAGGTFQIPLPARFGAEIDPDGAITGNLQGKFKEAGLLDSLFPGLFQESSGDVAFDIAAGGSWKTPALTGTIGVTRAGAYLPFAGIRLQDVEMAARLEGSELTVDSLRMGSGAGTLEGTATLSFSGRELTGYRGTLRGNRFQIIKLPELQLMLSPDLTITGNQEKATVRGEIRIPEMQLNSIAPSTMIKPSRDVIVPKATRAATKSTLPNLDLQYDLILGDKVEVNTNELQAQLEGAVQIKQTILDQASGTGEIRVTRGTYQIYGVKLGIKRGKALFSGGSVERPTLDILALREVTDVKAGVTVTGTPEVPLIKLYSEPALPDTDILSYIVLGQKIGSNGEQNALLMQAAALMASSRQSGGIQEMLKQLTNIDTISFAAPEGSGSGYKPVESSLLATSQSKPPSDATSQTMLQIGKFLTPRLYISYGRSLMGESQQLRARYRIGKKWEIESKTSTEATGGDLYYLIELD